jgi:hypothetical protein
METAAASVIRGVFSRVFPPDSPARKQPQHPPDVGGLDGEDDEEDPDYDELEEAEEDEDDKSSVATTGAGSWDHLRPSEERKHRPPKYFNHVQQRRYDAARRSSTRQEEDELSLREAVSRGEISMADFVQFRTLTLLERSSNRLAGKEGRSAVPGYSADPGLGGQSGGSIVTRGVSQFHAYRRSIIETPKEYLEEFDEQQAELSLQDDGSSLSYAEVGMRRIPWGKLRGLARVYQMLANILKHQKRGHHAVATAFTAAAMNSVTQCALDNGEWRVAWLMSGLPQHMFSRKRFAGSERQAETMAAYLTAEDRLNTFAKTGAAAKADDFYDEEEQTEGPAGGGKGRRGRGRQQQQGQGKDGAAAAAAGKGAVGADPKAKAKG